MTFNSLAYLILLCGTVTAYAFSPAALRIAILLTASVVFYAWWSLPFVGLIVLSAAVDYAAGLLLERYDRNPGARRICLVVSLATNLAILGYFKYANFFIENITALSGGTQPSGYLEILLPPGISFYTFQSMSYTIDVYRREITPTRSFARFFLYVSFFPQLVAGPIERAGHLLPQFEVAVRQRMSRENLVSGAQWIIWGLAKKMLVADYCGLLVEHYYRNPGNFDGSAALVATYAFSIQIYFDFSAYSDIARGSARLFGIDIMANFDQPLIATNIADYWRRWHISLYNWFRDYVYIPLGGNQVGRTRLLVNVALVVALSGLWHGAAWRYVLWGLYHGALMVITVWALRSAWFPRFARSLGRARGLAGWFLQFHLCVAGFVIFCSSSLSDSGHTFRAIGRALSAGLPLTPAQLAFLGAVAVFLLCSAAERKWRVMAWVHGRAGVAVAVYGALIVLIALYGHTGEQPFFYFQF
jgi:D-alanyl-lipoteichoic acid acyltransferase DltB (MBOAT superfamily)